MFLHPLHQPSAIDAIDPDASQSFACAQPSQSAQHEPCSTRVGGGSSCYYYSQEQSHRISHQVPLTSHHSLVGVIPTHAWHLGGLDRLAVQASSTCLLITPNLTAKVR